MVHALRLSLLSLLFSLCLQLQPIALADPVVTQATQEIVLTTQATIIASRYEVTNSDAKPLTEFVVCVSEDHSKRRAFLEAVQGDSQLGDPAELKARPVARPATPDGVDCTLLTLADEVDSGSTSLIETYAVYTGLVHPKPAEITQGETQRVVYDGRVHFNSPYTIKSQITKIKLPSSNVESYTKEQPTSLSDSTITYGPYEDIGPYGASTPLHLHYENNSPFLEALSLTRDIEVSHWGNVYVEERYVLLHTGAKHKGEWSRLDYMTKAMQGPGAVVAEVKAILPAGAHSIYYRDGIGNISTSHVRSSLRDVEVTLRPRFPLLGGWKVEFTFGYSLPLERAVRKLSTGQYELALQFSPAIAGLVVRNMDIKVAVPEGSKELQAEVNYPTTQGSERRFTYLDIVGRPVLTLQTSNLVSITHDVFTVTYRLPGFNLLLEPGLLVTAFLAVFGVGLVCSRWELSLSQQKPSGGRRQQSGAESVGQVSSLLSECGKALGSLEGNLPLGTSKSSVRQTVDQQLRGLIRKLKDLRQDVHTSTGFSTSNFDHLVLRQQALHKAVLQRFDTNSYAGGIYAHAKEQKADPAASDAKIKDLYDEMLMLKNLLAQGATAGKPA